MLSLAIILLLMVDTEDGVVKPARGYTEPRSRLSRVFSWLFPRLELLNLLVVIPSLLVDNAEEVPDLPS